MAVVGDEDREGVPTLKRTCHLCEQAVESHVWYAKTVEDADRPHRIYACPSCYFDLDDETRARYYRERV